MSTHIKILNKSEINIFSSPPVFNSKERKQFFYLPKWASKLLEGFRTPVNRVGFILQLAYFKATNSFFVAHCYHHHDIRFIANRLGISPQEIDISKYNRTTFERHQEYILENMGIRKFDDSARRILRNEAYKLCTKQTKPRLMFISLVDFLRRKKIETPGYNTFADIITRTIREYEKVLILSIEENLSTAEKQLLDNLLKFGEAYQGGDKQVPKLKRYKITLLKKSNQSTQPSKIKENIQDLQCLDSLFKEMYPIIKKLNLSTELIQYYAQIVVKSRVFQINRIEKRRYLLLIAFVAYQYFRLNDILIEVLMQSVQNKFNSIEKRHKENFYNQRKEKQKKLTTFSDQVSDHLNTVKNAKTILHDQFLSAEEKVKNLTALFSDSFDNGSIAIEKQIVKMGEESTRITKNIDYYDLLEANSVKLQNRVSDIVKNLYFNHDTSNSILIQAIVYYRKKGGNLTSDAPSGFLETEEQELVFDNKDKLKISLYKVLLFMKIAEAIRSGALNLKYSYKYRAFDDYLISAKVWNANKEELLEKAGLKELKDYSKVECLLKGMVQDQFRITNENIVQGVNKYASFSKALELLVKTPRKEKDPPVTTIDIFPHNRFISLFEVLTTVNRACQFTGCFDYWQIKHEHKKPADKTIFAGIIGLGCNLGIHKTAKISRNINQYELENTINWYFSHDNIIRANDKILEFMDKLELHRLFKRNQNVSHTSSDGQKYSIGVESLNANYSYKYFGKGKGVSIYSFIDESHRLFYSTVINPAEREAAYVIDGLMHNDVVKSDIHSTDTHGYSEIIFATTYLLGISFAPRIKSFRDQYLYSFQSPSSMKALGYNIYAQKKINTKIIQQEWDNILRLATTIKLKETSASQLFKRLSSYSRQHPLYRALKQLGRIIKTIFLLRYIDDIELRQMIEKQLNKLESSNKFAKAVFHGRNQEFQHSSKEEQLIAEGCKRLMMP